ncbi:IS630 family transposase [Desulfocucumis palustris]|uniref:IS630 family transposase n=1 Tax=Desulfocucumis palustris TaxID=1898651 RepID=A0A2L2XF28_9FIRM|nr:IS630 family transposase [Desulfocucumis palustris]GBF34303.1 IS630 family transposase [Desulfocucumis palustris]
MPFQSHRAKLNLTLEEIHRLETIIHARTEGVSRVERAKIFLFYNDGESISSIARILKTNRPKIERHINKALEFGIDVALNDLPRPGKPESITMEDKVWLISLACKKPKEFGYSYELWTTDLLSKHVRKYCEEYGHTSLKNLSRGTVSKILSANQVKPHKIQYYLERKDPDFDQKMANVLYVYKEVQVVLEKGNNSVYAYLSYDEKPGIQAIENTVPDLPPSPGVHPCVGRDYEYIRHGTLSLMAGIDLTNGQILANVTDRHRSREFVEFLKMVDEQYKDKEKIKIILDNHSAHISKETRAYLNIVPNRFEFVFTPKHGSWLNLIESFFGKMAQTMLRAIRVKSKEELKERIYTYIKEINDSPTIYRWKYKIDDFSIV